MFWGYSANKIECSRLEQSSLIKFLLVKTCKPSEIYRRMYGNAYFYQKMFMNKLNLCLPLYIFTNPSAWRGYDTRSIFKWSLTDLNSEFFLLRDKLLSPRLKNLVCPTIYKPESKRQFMMGKHTDSLVKKKFQVQQSIKEIKLAVFWDMKWPISINLLKKRCNCKQCLPLPTTLAKFHLIYWMTLVNSHRKKMKFYCN